MIVWKYVQTANTMEESPHSKPAKLINDCHTNHASYDGIGKQKTGRDKNKDEKRRNVKREEKSFFSPT